MLLILTCAASGWANNITCSLSPATTWTAAGNGNWTTGSNWNNGAPNGTNAACIIDGASTLSLTTFANITGLQLAAGNTLNLSGVLSTTGSMINNGAINLVGTSIQVNSPVSLAGSGTVTLNASDIYGFPQFSSIPFTNQSTIVGTGVIGPAPYSLNLNNQGTFNANVNGGTLQFYGGNTIANTGLLEGTGGGTLLLQSGVNNAGGTILANGGAVTVASTIQGGILTTAAGGTMNSAEPRCRFMEGNVPRILGCWHQWSVRIPEGRTL
jgi:hypothetical protein